MIKNKVKYIHVNNRKQKIIILDSREDDSLSPCIMWIHGGGYSMGMPEMVYASRVKDLLKDNSLVVISPRYRLSISAPYPAALEDWMSITLSPKDIASLAEQPKSSKALSIGAGWGLSGFASW